MVGMVEMVMSNDKVSQRVKRLSKGGSQKNMNHGEKGAKWDCNIIPGWDARTQPLIKWFGKRGDLVTRVLSSASTVYAHMQIYLT
jgi:hypothetical protein